MSSIKRFLAVVSLVAILKPTLIYSLPQGSLDSENSPLISTEPGQIPAPIVNTDASDTDGDNPEYTALIGNDVGPDSVIATNPDPSSSTEDDSTIAAKPGDTVVYCQSKSDQQSDKPGACSSRGTINSPQPENEREPDVPNTSTSRDPRCKAPWRIHVCGDGPASDSGRTDIPGYFHRMLIANMFPANEVDVDCDKYVFEACCAVLYDSKDPNLNWIGRNCLILRGVKVPAPDPLRIGPGLLN